MPYMPVEPERKAFMASSKLGDRFKALSISSRSSLLTLTKAVAKSIIAMKDVVIQATGVRLRSEASKFLAF